MIIRFFITIISLFFILSCAAKGGVDTPYDTPVIEVCRFYIDYKKERSVCVKSYPLFIDKCWIIKKEK